ncbi:MAG TPA: hypothetical protein VEC12_05325 [Bacteroidia bacterium]|nr:hypothetical protein [Bacteroidia bacterium]
MRILVIVLYILLVSPLNGQHRYYTSVHKPFDSNRIESILFINPYKAIDTGCINEISYNYHRYIRGIFIEVDSIGNEENWSFDNLIDRLENITLDYIGINIKLGRDGPHFDVSRLLNNTKLKALFDTNFKFTYLTITSSQKLYSKELLSVYEVENVEIYCEKLIFNNDSVFVNPSVKSVAINTSIVFESGLTNIHIEELNNWNPGTEFKYPLEPIQFEKLKSIHTSTVTYKNLTNSNFNLNTLKEISLVHTNKLGRTFSAEFKGTSILSQVHLNHFAKKRLNKVYLKNLPDSINIDINFVKKSSINVNKGYINELMYRNVNSTLISCNSCDKITIKSMYMFGNFTFKVSQKTYVKNLYYGSDKRNFSNLKISDKVHINNMHIGYREINNPEKSAKRLSRLNVDTLTIKIRVAAPGELEDQLVDCPTMGKDMAYTEEECGKLSRLKELLPGKVIEVVPY